MKFSILLVAVMIPLLCSCVGSVSTTEPIVTEASEHDFGFVGEWNVVPDKNHSDDAPEYSIDVSLDENSKTDYTVCVKHENGNLDYQMKAFRLSDQADYAVIQIEGSLFSDAPTYSYGYALRKGEQLFLWGLQDDKLVALIEKEKLNSIIHHKNYTTIISADPAKLLDLIANHSNSLVTETTQAYTRQR